MKKLLITSAVAIAIVSTGAIMVSADSDTQEPNQVESVKPVESTSPRPQATVTVQPTVQAPVQEEVPEPTKVTETPPATPGKPTNESLKSQYGWTQSPSLDSINFIINRFPNMFQDSNREASFDYIKRAADAAGIGGVSKLHIDIMGVQGITDRYWPRIGAKYGVTL